MVSLKHFDAFPKTSEAYETSGPPNNPFKYALLVFGVFFLYLETTSWMTSLPSHHFEVDKGINDHFQINLDLLSRNKCDEIAIYIQDMSDDSLLVNELVSLSPYFTSPEDTTEWCQIQGIFETNKVKGRLTISGIQRFGSRDFDTTHAIKELSFGEFYPDVDNTLDYTAKEVTEPSIIEYYLSIVPTRFRALGFSVDTYLYSAKNRVISVATTFQYPKLTFDYDFDPIKIDIEYTRMSFFQWMLRVINIGGGLIFAARAATRLLKRRISRYENTGLLDVPLKSKEAI